MARDKAVFDLWRADMDAPHVVDLVAPVVISTARFAYLVVMAKVGDQFAFGFAARMHVNGVVNRLVGHRFLKGIMPKGLQFERYLLWCQSSFS
jgi:hypothetical protein